MFFYKKSVGALQEAVRTFERVEAGFDPHRTRANAARFDTSVFRERMHKAIQARLEGWWQ